MSRRANALGPPVSPSTDDGVGVKYPMLIVSQSLLLAASILYTGALTLGPACRHSSKSVAHASTPILADNPEPDIVRRFNAQQATLNLKIGLQQASTADQLGQ